MVREGERIKGQKTHKVWKTMQKEKKDRQVTSRGGFKELRLKKKFGKFNKMTK